MPTETEQLKADNEALKLANAELKRWLVEERAKTAALEATLKAIAGRQAK